MGKGNRNNNNKGKGSDDSYMKSVLEKSEYKGEIVNWVKNGLNETAVKFASEFAKAMVKQEATTTQFRNFYGQLLVIKQKGYSSETKNQFLLLKPRLAYAVARNNKKQKPFYDLVVEMMDNVKEEDTKTFQNFFSIVESILAYFKFHKTF